MSKERLIVEANVRPPTATYDGRSPVRLGLNKNLSKSINFDKRLST
jgi:hypothetical protein